MTANWTRNEGSTTYAVTLEDAGTGASGGGTYEQGKTVTLSAGTKTGYTFAGWVVTEAPQGFALGSGAKPLPCWPRQ